MRFVLILLTATLAIAGEFTTSLGDTYPHTISAITTDSAGNTYIVGSRQLGGGPYAILGGVIFDPIINILSSGGSDVFVTKLDPNGRVLFTDTFAGKGVDTGSAIALDPSGNIYIAGATTSNDFPLSKALQTQPSTCCSTGFIIKLSNDGSTILYSTYFGGTLGSTSINSIATDAKGNLYLTGITTSADFPHTAGMPFGPNPLPAGGLNVIIGPLPGINSGAILACISAADDKILYSGALTGGPIPIPGGATQPTRGVGVAVDAAGNAYFAGNIGGGAPLPTTPGVLSPTRSFSGFVAKVSAAGAGLSYLTYLPSFTSAIAVDAAGDAYLAGFNFAVRPGSPPNGYVAKLNPTASAVVWTSNLMGQAVSVNSIALDSAGDVWANGAASPAFPNTNGWTTGSEYVVGLNNDGAAFTYSALYPGGTVAQSVALDPSGLVHIAGLNGFVSAIAPTTAPTTKIFAFQNAFGGKVTARISPAEVISIYGPNIGPATAATAAPTNGFYPTTFSGAQVQINGANIPLLYVSANQINAVVPMGLATGVGATIRVINGTTVSADYPVWILASTPQAFPTVLNQNGTINSQTNPAKGGSIVTFYATGWQPSFYPLADGQVATVAQDYCAGSCEAFPLTNVTSSATVLYGGAAPGIIAGVSQFNIHIGSVQSYAGTSPLDLELVGPFSVIIQTVWIAP